MSSKAGDQAHLHEMQGVSEVKDAGWTYSLGGILIFGQMMSHTLANPYCIADSTDPPTTYGITMYKV